MNRPTGVRKRSNEYAMMLPLDKMPKTVLAAIALSFATRCSDSDSMDDIEAGVRTLFDEWRILHENGIVPQKPVNMERDNA